MDDRAAKAVSTPESGVDPCRSLPERLVEVAGPIFAERGPRATVREICKAAGCSVAAINYYFGDKHKLYLRCVQEASEFKKKHVPLPEMPSDAPADQRLYGFLHALCRRVSLHSSKSWHSALMLREVLDPSEGVAELLKKPFGEDYVQLIGLLGELLGAERDDERLRTELATEIIARCMFLRTGAGLRSIVGIDIPENEDPEIYASTICQSILRQISALKAEVGESTVPRPHGLPGINHSKTASTDRD